MIKQIPNDWEITRIDKCCNILDSQRIPLSGAVRSTKKGVIPYYGANGLLDFINDHIFDDNLILVAEDGGHFGDYQNRTIAYNISGKSWVNNHAHILKPKANYNFNYIFYQLEHKNIVPFINGSTREKLNQSDLRAILIPIPENAKEQTAIATILSKVDEAIEATKQSIKAAERLKKTLMQNLLTGKLKPDGIWRTEDEFQMTKIGLLPKEWLVKTVKNISTQVTDGEHTTPERSESGYYLLSARNIKNSYLDLSNVDYVLEKELRKIQRRCNPQFGDILVSCSGTIGNVCIVPEGLDAGMVRSAALIKLKKDEIESEFAELVFQSFNLQNQMKTSVASSVQGNIFQGAIKKLRIPYPPTIEERNLITDKINGIAVIIERKQTKIQTLQRLKKSLMQNMLTGKVRLDVEFINKIISEQ